MPGPPSPRRLCAKRRRLVGALTGTLALAAAARAPAQEAVRAKRVAVLARADRTVG